MGRIDRARLRSGDAHRSYRNWQLMSDISGFTAMSASDTLYPRSRRSRAVFRGTSDVRNVPSIMRLYPMMESASTIASTIRPAHAAVCAGESMPYWAQILTKPRVDGAVVITVNHNSIAFLKCEKDIVQRCFARTALAS